MKVKLKKRCKKGFGTGAGGRAVNAVKCTADCKKAKEKHTGAGADLELPGAKREYEEKKTKTPEEIFLEEFSFDRALEGFGDNCVDLKRAFAYSVVSLCAYSKKRIAGCLKAAGFQGVSLFNYQDKSGARPCAFAIGRKTEEGKNLLMVAVSGTVKKQWYSNFDLGENRFHRGFYSCCLEIKRRMEEFLERENLEGKNLKFCITGHSRGGAAANLAAVYLSEKFGKENVSCITFGSPNVAQCRGTKKDYENIVNFENQSDIITVCPPLQWGFGKFGRTVCLGEGGGSSMRRDFSESAWRIAKNQREYYGEKIPTEKGKSLSLYEYFRVLAGLMAKKYPFGEAARFMVSMNSGFGDISKILLEGYSGDPSKIKPEEVERLSCVKSHMGETYVKNLLMTLSGIRLPELSNLEG